MARWLTPRALHASARKPQRSLPRSSPHARLSRQPRTLRSWPCLRIDWAARQAYAERKRQARAFGMAMREAGASLQEALASSSYGQSEADLREEVARGWRAEDRAIAAGKTA